MDSVKRLLPGIAGALDELRRVAMDMRPSILDRLGIPATLSWLVREFEGSNLKTRLETIIGVGEQDVPEQIKIVIFRILQETINNAVKHADASCITIGLQNENGALTLIQAAGVDMSPLIGREPGLNGSFSLLRMRTHDPATAFDIMLSGRLFTPAKRSLPLVWIRAHDSSTVRGATLDANPPFPHCLGRMPQMLSTV